MADPLDNLVPGPKGDRLAGREMLVEAIAAALIVDYADDETVRREMGKAFDFVVTEAAREKLAAQKAAAVYEVMFSTIFDTVATGGEVSINGFATFRRGEPNDMVEVKMVSGFPEPILPSDLIVVEELTAEVEAGSWTGTNKARWPGMLGSFASGSEAGDGMPAGEFYRVGQSGVAQPGGWVEDWTSTPLERNRLKVTALGSDGVSREYFVGWLYVQVRGVAERVYGNGGEYAIDFITVGEPGREVVAWDSEYPGRPDLVMNDYWLGSGAMPVRAGEYGLLLARGVGGLTARKIKFEAFVGYPAEVLLPLYPRTRRGVREWGTVHIVDQIPRDEFYLRFRNKEAYLRSVGAWPARTRNFGASVKCEFRKEFIDSLNVPAGAPA